MRLHLITFFLFVVICSGCVSSTRGLVPYQYETVTTIKGNVNIVETVLNRQTNEDGLHLKILTTSGVYTVHVCPQWYADKTKIRFDKGESLIITGSAFIKDNEQNMYAATITDSAEHVLQLRNQDTGETMWTGRTRDESLPQKDQAKQEQTQQEMKESRQKSDTPFKKMNEGSNRGGQEGGMF